MLTGRLGEGRVGHTFPKPPPDFLIWRPAHHFRPIETPVLKDCVYFHRRFKGRRYSADWAQTAFRRHFHSFGVSVRIALPVRAISPCGLP
ncbi:TPA: hypothetical protein ACLA5P_000005 [Neisseria meningitidis]